jgi:hypothetical protein
MKKRKNIKIVLLIITLQILLLINFPISNSFFISSLGVVSAEENSNIVWNCCPEMKDGSLCQNIASVTPELCAVTPLPTPCANTADCKRGCCVDPEEGLCTPNSIVTKCKEGEFYENSKNCDIAKCQKGCCVLGKEAEFVTEERCELLSSRRGFEKEWSSMTEPECISFMASQKEGACILKGRCGRETEKECLSNGGEFYSGYLCSHQELSEYNCTKQVYINCFEGKDEIYWFDSCGNRENIYDADKDFSWNNGRILSKENSCGAGESNINSRTCGNCNRALSSICSETRGAETSVIDGNFVCKSLKCVEEDGTVRENGESWCAYDGYIGDGKDTVGSRHWKYRCDNGEIISDGCADYRGEICTQYDIEEDGKTFSIAECVINEAMACISYNEEENMEERCNENNLCTIKNVDVDKYFKFDVCVPKYPRGFNISDYSIGNENDNICGIASMNCTVVYQKDWKGSSKCKKNCDCRTKEFTEKMNDFCISLGDCGTYVNYIGEGTENVVRLPLVEGINPKVSDYVKYATPVEGQYAEPQNIEVILNYLAGTSLNSFGEIGTYSNNAINLLGKISGTTGGLISLASWIYGSHAATGVAGKIGVTKTLTSISIGETSMATTLGAVGSAAIGASIGMIAANWYIKEYGISGEAATVLALASGTAGAFAGLYLAGQISGATAGWGIGISLFIVAWVIFTGWGKTKTKIITFKCLPWEAPTGGNNCDLCNEDPTKPCSEYRCSSLGQSCILLNKNTENPICISDSSESNPPIISPGEILTKEHKFQNEGVKIVEIRENDGDCIEEWTNVIFTLKTDEPAQCRYDFELRETYENLGDFPFENNIYSEIHTFNFAMPSLDSLEVYGVTGDLKELFGNINMYVTCKDHHGNFNLDPYVVNFCVEEGKDKTAVNHLLTFTNPENGAKLKDGTKEISFSMEVNEPAECRYDTEPNVAYEDMRYSMECETDLGNYGASGWRCSSILENLNPGENKFYFKCKDKPWVQTEEDIVKYGERNVNVEDFVYTLYVTDKELNIDSINFKFEDEYIESGKTLKVGFCPISLDLEVETSGGVENGKSNCYYEWGGNWILLEQTGSNSHKQSNMGLMNGTYTIPIKCVDVVDNIDIENAIITIKIDDSSPIITRAYREGSSLELVTLEPAKCYYINYHNCMFNIKNGTDMEVGFSIFHSVEWNPQKTYYVKCEDVFGNTNSLCAIIVKPEEL